MRAVQFIISSTSLPLFSTDYDMTCAPEAISSRLTEFLWFAPKF